MNNLPPYYRQQRPLWLRFIAGFVAGFVIVFVCLVIAALMVLIFREPPK